MALSKISWHKNAWEDYLYWQKQDRAILNRINDLIKDIMRDPYGGKGKPKPLKFDLEGYWSRRIDKNHRLVYKVEGDTLIIVQCRYHY